MSDESEQNILLKSWQSALKRATDFDAWGQPVEAADIYSRLSKQLFQYVNDKSIRLFTKYQKRTLEKVAIYLDARGTTLSGNDSLKNTRVELPRLKHLEETLVNLLSDNCDENGRSVFPVEFSPADDYSKNQLQQVEVQVCEDEETSTGEFLTPAGKSDLLPKPFPVSGRSFLTVSIDHIGVKDGSQYLDPYISLSVRDRSGHCLDPTQDTPTASDKLDKAIVFHCDVHIQKAMECLSPGFAIFLEFKHFKPKKDSFSTMCWSFVEHDEIKDGPIALELYKKPTDFKRKSLKLLTVKPLFLHLHLSLNH